jgi:3-oxoacyl-[acyl-carrier protein] reductase
MKTLSTARELTFPEIAVGDAFTVEHTFTETDVRVFAELSGDYSPLHVDPTYASTTEFGRCVVHGMLLASLFSRLVGMYLPGKHALYLGQDLAFRKPVLVGELVKASAKVTAKNEGTRTLLLATEIRNLEDKSVVSGSAKVKLRDTAVVAADASPQAPTSLTADRPVALITGASRGIGATIAATLGSRGANVAVNYYRSESRAEQLVDAIRKSGGDAVALQGDVRKPDDVARIIESTRQRFGRLDWVVNAAIDSIPSKPFMEMEWSDFQGHFEYQIKSALHVCQAAFPLLKQSTHAAIVNILSQVTADQPPPRVSDYVSAKYALMGLSKALAVEWAEHQIRVNMISPGLVQTDLTQHYHDRLFKMEASRTPLKRIAQPSDIAHAAAFLLSKDASFLTGVNLSVTGGQVML